MSIVRCFLKKYFFCFLFFYRDDRRDQEDRDEKDEELKPLTRDELKQRAIDHVRNLEKRALQEQSKYSELGGGGATTGREKSMTAGSKGATGGDGGKAGASRGR